MHLWNFGIFFYCLEAFSGTIGALFISSQNSYCISKFNKNIKPLGFLQ